MPHQPPSDHPQIALGSYSNGRCWVCEKRFADGLAIVDASGTPLASLCIWCLVQWLDHLTDFRVTEQLLAWYTTKNKRGRPRNDHRGLVIRRQGTD